ncbi:DNA repair metallo-beta-lactamase-domain-containing protein [Apiospora aurea]|uniref:DNA repair metallo-beta-lactamase-domain-containing protein n=1 Tax=Apiospora aurea TaxID=335848 RepID=A0ABR1QC22_9PEZI
MPPARTARAKPANPRQSKLNFGPPQANGKTSASKQKLLPANGNILNFFKKVHVEEPLFIGDPSVGGATAAADAALSSPIRPKLEEQPADDIHHAEPDDDPLPEPRFNEDVGSSKRRKMSHDGEETDDPATAAGTGTSTSHKRAKRTKAKKGPFLDDSDSEPDSALEASPPKQETPMDSPGKTRPALLRDESCAVVPELPQIKTEDSVYDDFKDMDEMEALFDDELDDGEEYRAMRYMQEQARLEAEDGMDQAPDGAGEGSPNSPNEGDATASCPLCNASLAGLSVEHASVHVNACLDGNPLPPPKPPAKPPPEPSVQSSDLSKRFSRAAVPRPGQANPIELGSKSAGKPTSAFSKLMSTHAEDEAWASAAATETASRGKPAYQRTCPFYKIMPGFCICVDAFRYGAVKGCSAYFLSHFHSDHYIGLTASWSHGPIYCSKVTGSLVKNQLRTAAKWVVELEFDEQVEIPGTEGVTVTMIPANHCPGSSLFLFEKSAPRTQRILHCGDFRACQAHIAHPLLKPDVVDSISGKTRQQKIDICYLDTTYLNPRYSFPPQEMVISACAEFCKTISGDPNATDDAFEALKGPKGTTSVSNFFTKGSEGNEAPDGKHKDDTKANPKHRLLVICGTYSIGKERICKAIAQALNTRIFASASKIKIIKQLGDPELTALLTTNPREAQVHMQMLMEIRAETLQEYLNGYKPHFSRIVGFRPSGWNFRSPTSTARSVNVNVQPSSVPSTQVLHGPAWRTRFGPRDFAAQRGSTREAMCFGVPYSEHSSFRELALFTMALRIEKVVPTVNVGSEASRKRMKGWLDRWIAERRRGGVVKVLPEGAGETKTEDGDGGSDKGSQHQGVDEDELWGSKDGKGGWVSW